MSRVLIFSPKFPPYSGGASQYFPNLVDKLSDEDLQISVITPYHVSKPCISGEDNKRVYRVIPRFDHLPSVFRAAFETVLPFFISVFLILYKEIDVVHAHSTSYSTPGVGLASSLTETPIIYDCRDENFPKWAIKIGNPLVLFSCSPRIDEEIVKAGYNRDQIIRVPALNPEYVEEYEFNPLEVDPDEKFEIVFVGYLKPIKNVPNLIRAFSIFNKSNPNTHLTIVGDGPLREELEQLVVDQEIANKVTFEGSVEHRDALRHMASGDVVVLPSQSEGDPRVVREAMQIGVPLLVTPVGTVPELLEDGVSALFIDQSVESILESLNRIYCDNELYVNLSINSRREIEQIDWDQLRERVKQGYKVSMNM